MKTKKNILIFTDWYLPGFKAGGPIKSVSSIVQLLKNEFYFHIVTSNTDFGETNPYKDIASDCWIDAKDYKIIYLSKKNITINNIFQLLSNNKFDLIYCNSLFSFYFSIVPMVFKRLNILKTPLLISPRGMLGEGALKLKSLKKNIFLKIIKIFNIPKKIYWHATSAQESQEIKNHFGKNIKVDTVGNLQITNNENAPVEIFKNENKVKFLFLSRISEKKNLLFALNCFLELENKDKEIIFDILGPIENEVYWNKCESVIDSLKQKGLNITYKGIVKSEEVKKTIESYHFLFLPTLNENFGHVIVESFFAARPVIISNQTPWRNLQFKNAGWDFNLDNKEEFVKVLNKCIAMSNDEYQKMSQSSLLFGQENCKFDEDIVKTAEMFNSIINA